MSEWPPDGYVVVARALDEAQVIRPAAKIGTQLRIRLPNDYTLIPRPEWMDRFIDTHIVPVPRKFVECSVTMPDEAPAPAPEPKRLTLGEEWIRDWGRGPVW